MLNYWLLQKYKLLKYGKFNHFTNTSNIRIFVYNCLFMMNELANYFVHAQSNSWSLSRISEFGYAIGNATNDELYFEVSMLNSTLGFDYRIYRHIFFCLYFMCRYVCVLWLILVLYFGSLWTQTQGMSVIAFALLNSEVPHIVICIEPYPLPTFISLYGPPKVFTVHQFFSNKNPHVFAKNTMK